MRGMPASSSEVSLTTAPHLVNPANGRLLSSRNPLATYCCVVLHNIGDVDDLLTATGCHPLTRSSLILCDFHTGWTDGTGTIWVGSRGRRTWVTGSGSPTAVAAILGEVVDRLPAAARFSVPAGSTDPLEAHRKVDYGSGWELRWTNASPPADPRPEIEWLPAGSADVAELIAAAYPSAEARPGDPAVRGWMAVRGETGQLLAAAADTSGDHTGRMSAVMTAPIARGRGLGAAVTIGLCRRLLTEFDLVILGHYLDNDAARRLYDRTGFHGSLTVMSGSWTARTHRSRS